MAKVRILAFAEARELLGEGEIWVEASLSESPRLILQRLYPDKIQKLSSWRVAVDRQYWEWDRPVGTAEEIAVIPPVSGG
ncbi:MoaD/ThiS family protein [Candidatus Methylacidithermus pantelleriae]|uniref:ThiamineS protein n=1 Tax=Candidatus Methylacidithermus pantelleriae TaxID=2744239 RepID=A0A8J2BNF1_9BACT|nr:MoaD/ThiS family protein [Candidatus Methylacidithermus pantelleriae]CAF0693603.1 ThiamineS protein [Candidatus Methylacidithermus pantelleriae]